MRSGTFTQMDDGLDFSPGLDYVASSILGLDELITHLGQSGHNKTDVARSELSLQ